MKVFISVDMEGITGVATWSHVMRKQPEYQEARERMIADTNAAIEGALDAGGEEIIVNDSHDTMTNLPIAKLNPKARLISGFTKPLVMMQGVEGTDAALFIGYHARMGTLHGALDHTFFGGVVSRVSLNGTEVGEPELNAVIAGHFNVPVVFISGDETVCELAKASIGKWLETAPVKKALGRTAVECLHPDVTGEMIKSGVRRALTNLDAARPLQTDLPARLEIELTDSEMADVAEICPGTKRLDARTIVVQGETVLEAFHAFQTIGLLAATPMLFRRLQ